MPEIDVVRTYLEMTDPAQLRDGGAEPEGARLDRVRDCPPDYYRWLYRVVGERWGWRDRADWSDERIAVRLADRRVSLHVLYVEGAPAGWAELERHDDGATEIVYFGLLPDFAGRGLGKWLLARMVEEGWRGGATRVWLHTCTLDSPRALPNYLARGFREVRRETYRVRQ